MSCSKTQQIINFWRVNSIVFLWGIIINQIHARLLFFPLKYIMKPINFSDPHTHTPNIYQQKSIFWVFVFIIQFRWWTLLRSSPDFLIRYAIGDPHSFKYKKKNCARSQLSNFFRQNEIGLLSRKRPISEALIDWNHETETVRHGISRGRERRAAAKKNHFLNHKNFAC